jgi:hypothetical protein
MGDGASRHDLALAAGSPLFRHWNFHPAFRWALMRVLIGCEQFGHMREAFRRRGWDAWSCDLVPARDGSPHHIQGDVLGVLGDGWDLGIFHPDCTYLTCSAEWAYADPDFERYPGVGYHQKIKPGTLVGVARREAREKAVEFVFKLRDAPIHYKAIENPIGILSSRWRKADQTVQPYMFGDDASKGTCWWLEGGLPKLVPTKKVEPRMVNGRPRWGNQTDGGQNKLPPSEDRAMLRAETYPGHAEACADQWGSYVATRLGPQFSEIKIAMPFMSRAVEVRGMGWRSNCPACVASKFTCDEHYGLVSIHKPMIVDVGQS